MNKQFAFDLPHRTAFGVADFLVAPSNRIAVKAIDKWQNWQPPAMVLLGEAQSGKTHLANVWQVMMGASNFYFDANKNFLLADDIDKKLNKIDENILFSTLNRILSKDTKNGAFLFTASQIDWWQKVKMPDLRSRLKSIPAIEINQPDEQLICAVLIKLFTDRQLQVPETLLNWLLSRMPRNFAEANKIVALLDSESTAQNRPITLALAREVLF